MNAATELDRQNRAAACERGETVNDNGGALQTPVFQWTKRGGQVVPPTPHRDLCAIVRLQQLLVQDSAENNASDTPKSPKAAEKMENERLTHTHTHNRPGVYVCPATSDRGAVSWSVNEHVSALAVRSN